MKDEDWEDPVVEEIWEIRRRLAAEIGNDPHAIAAHMAKFQEQFRDRFLYPPASDAKGGKSAA